MVRVSQQLLSVLLSGLIAGLGPASALANPAGGVVQGGAATISGQGTSNVTINQTSNSAVLSWQSFNIAPGESTNFVQPSARALALNRILDGQASQILGNLNANGRVYLINPNGILFGQGAVVNVGGLAAATNAQVTNLVNAQVDAAASAQGAPGASITNQGRINVAPGGDVYLVGAKVENSTTGVIHVDGGTVTVASGATLTLAGEDGVAVEYQVPTTPDNTAVNLGQILADKGTADIRAAVVRQGAAQASAAVEIDGQIVLVGDSVRVAGDTATDNGKVGVTALNGDVEIAAGGNVRSNTGDIAVTAGRDVTFTSTDRAHDSVIETGSGNIDVVAERDVNLQPNVNAAGNTAIRTRGIDVEQPDGTVVHEKGDGGNVVVIAKTGNVNAGTADRWVDSVPPLERTAFGTFGLDYPKNFDPLPVDPRGILGIGSEAGGNVTVIAGGNVATRRTDVNVTRTGGSATALPPSDPDAPLPFDYDGSHIGVFGQAYTTLELPPFAFPVNSLRIPVANAPKAKLTVIAGGDITGDYMIRNGTATLRAGYALAPDALPQVAADPGALAAIEASSNHADPTSQFHFSDAATADPSRGWLGSLGSPLTLDMVFASVDGRGANGVALRAAENPSLVYPSSNINANGTAKLPTYGEDDTLALDAERGDVVLLGTDTVLREAGSTATTTPNPFVLMLPPSVSIATHDFTRNVGSEVESRSGDLVILNDFQMLPSEQGGLSLNVAGEVRTAGVAASGKAKVQIDVQSFGASGDQSFTLLPGLKLRDTANGAEYTLDGQISMQPRLPPTPAQGSVQFNISPDALAHGITIPKGTVVVAQNGTRYTTDRELVIPPPAQRPRQTQVVLTLAQAPSGPVTVAATAKLVGPDGALYNLDQAVNFKAGQTSALVTVTAQQGGGKDLRPGQLQLAAPVAEFPGLTATNITISTRKAITAVTVTAEDTGLDGNSLPRRVAGLETPIPGVISVTNSSALSNGSDLAEFGKVVGGGVSLPTISALTVLGPAGVAPQGSTLVIEPGQNLPAGISTEDIVITAGGKVGGSDALVPAVFRTLQVTHDDAGKVSTRVDPARGELLVLDPSLVWTSSASAPSGLSATAHIVQSRASPDIDGRGGAVFNYADYYTTCRSGAACRMQDPVNVDPNGVPLPTTLRGTGPTHSDNPSPALLLAYGGYHRIGFDLAESATVWSGKNVVDLQLKAQNTSATDLTQIVVPYGNATFGAGTETLVDHQLGSPVNVELPDDPGAGMNVSGPGRARMLVGVAPHVDPIEGFEGPLAALVPAPVDPQDDGIRLADWTGSAESFTGLDERGKLPGTGDGVLTASEAPWVPTAKALDGTALAPGSAGRLELDDVGGGALGSVAEPLILGLLTSGNASNAALARGGASLEVVTAGDVLMHRFGAVGAIQGGDLSVTSVAGQITATQPPSTYTRQRGFLTMNAEGSTNEPEGGGKISLDASGDVDTGGSAVATLSSSDIAITTRTGSITAGHGEKFEIRGIGYDPVTGTPQISYAGAGFFASGDGNVKLTARKDINLGAGIRAQGIQLTAGGNITAGTGSAQASTISIDAGGTISGHMSATSISIGSGTVSSGATLTAGVVSGAGGSVSNTGANQVSAGSVLSGSSPQAGSITETAAGAAQSGLRSVIIDISSRPCESQECR
ncbi:MAG TPA: filamentous hemagglutinin N-terminal domain-containing protein [Myxococcota bacterium]|nr:filamentous hemagglutinin N-terminal domain-containing protein [Myxococcota bacterium]